MLDPVAPVVVQLKVLTARRNAERAGFEADDLRIAGRRADRYRGQCGDRAGRAGRGQGVSGGLRRVTATEPERGSTAPIFGLMVTLVAFSTTQVRVDSDRPGCCRVRGELENPCGAGDEVETVVVAAA